MNYHAQLHRPDAEHTEAESMAVAFSNLLMKLDIELDPTVIQQEIETKELTWDVISSVEPRLMPIKFGEYGTWPEGAHSIVKFRYIKSDGIPSDHYCVLANPANQTIVDSLDARTKHAGMYNEPTGWATYALDSSEEEDEVEEESPTEIVPVTIQRSGMLYKVLSGENVWRVAQRFDIPVDALMAHNEITDPKAVQPGMNIYIPLSHAKEVDKPIVYEVLAQPRPMHVSNPDGAKRWSFGNVKTWKDIKDNGQRYPQNHNLSIYAIAHVPVEGEIAAYYMDQNSLGDYKQTGRVRYMLGFNWSHLADGHVTPDYIPEPVLDEEVVEKIEEALAEQKHEEEIAAEVEAIEAHVEPAPSFKETYWANEEKDELQPDGTVKKTKVVRYVAKQDMMIFDHEGLKPTRPLYSGQPVHVVGIFEKEGNVYGLPDIAERNGWWYGVPMENLEIEDELYNTDVDLSEKIALKRELSLDESITVFFSKRIAQVERWRTRIVKK